MWPRLINAALGIWLMAAPAVLDYGVPAANNDRIMGPLIATFAVIAIWETTRELRRVNALWGAWLIIAPLLLGYEGAAVINSIAVGVVVIGVSMIRGKVEGHFGGGWTALWRPEHAEQAND